MRTISSLTIGFTLLISACAEIRVHQTIAEVPIAEKVTETVDFVGFGLKPLSSPIDLSNRCPDGWQTIVYDTTFKQSLLRVLSLNIYSPWRSQVYCRFKVVKEKTLEEKLGGSDDNAI